MNIDCLPYMESCKDNQFSLAIVDPPYGININNQAMGLGGGVAKKIKYIKKQWDKKPPTQKYFNELKRVSKNQIIWGGNYFISKIKNDSSCWIIWDKDNSDTDFADCELAWTSFNTAVRKIKWRWAGMLQQNMKDKERRIHPTQKPAQLYKWLLMNYAKKGQTIFDSHCGSGSIMIACYDLDFDLTACEIDKEYFDAANKRFNNHKAQLKLF